MSIIRLYVSLKVPDNVARSALTALRRRMGYSSLMDLKRSEFWEIEFPDLTPEQAHSTLDRLTRKTAFFANPNKHRWEIENAGRALNDETEHPAMRGAQASVLVCDREDGRAEGTLEALQRQLGGTERPSRLQHGVWWDLYFEGVSADDARRMSEEMAPAVERGRGLLANPHYQDHIVFHA
ncbi:MAG: hypothetical protein GC154_16355 [bacterium]|nr:hypothetical protein [bacterium]